MRGSKSQISNKFSNTVPAGKKTRVPLISFFCDDPKSNLRSFKRVPDPSLPGTDNEVPADYQLCTCTRSINSVYYQAPVLLQVHVD